MIVGCILTTYTRRFLLSSCGNVGKLTRIANAVAQPDFYSLYPRKNPEAPFLVLGGFADFILPSTYSPGHGAIVGLGNVAPVCYDFSVPL
jgi:4-hydroxy-2-oxoglutarate aldolase